MSISFNFFLSLLLFTTAATLLAQSPDSIPVYDLSTLTVSAGKGERLPNNAPVQRIEGEDIKFFNAESPLAGVNTIPGVRFEERSPGSYRLSIRGSALRAPFGVRNVKVYWNGFPLTEPGGDTPLNVLDVANMPALIVYKGPAGSLYGSGTGGALLINGDQTNPKRSDDIQLEGGSFGYGRFSWAHRRNNDQGIQSTYRIAHQQTDGYRRHSQFRRTTGEVYLFRPGAQTGDGLKIHALLSNLDYEIPGGLNPEQFAENPRQSRPGSIETKAGVKQQFFLVGLSWTKQLASDWQLDNRAYLTGNLFENPFNVDYKRETNLGGGNRTVLGRTFRLSTNRVLSVKLGAEAQYAHKSASNYGTNEGFPGALNFLDDIDTYQLLGFGRLNYRFAKFWEITTSLSAQRLIYDIDRTFNANGPSRYVKATFPVVFAPRVSLSRRFPTKRADYSVFLAYGRAYSPPTLREFRTNEGSLNVSLAPERGDAIELGLKRRSLAGIDLDLNVYYQLLNESITTFQDSSGVQLFRNAGGNRQFGVELAANQQLLRSPSPSAFWQSIHLRAAYTYQSGRYRDFQTARGDFSDQPLPGLSPNTLDLQLNVTTRPGFYFRAGLYTAAQTPLNDANDVFAEAYSLVRLRLGRTIDLKEDRSLDIYLGVNNLLDEQFSLGYDLNPEFGNRYFQPAPGINYFAGLRYQFKRD